MTRFGDGLATGADLPAAAERAAGDALAALDGRVPDLVCAFVSGGDSGQVAAALERVAVRCGAMAVLGCSAGGVIGAGRGVEGEGAVAVWAAVLPGAALRTFHLEVVPADGGAAVVGMPERGGDDEVVVLLADPWSFPVDGFLARADEALAGLPFVGGLAGGGTGPGGTRLLVDGRTVDRGAVGVVLAGSGARAVVSQGCRPVGPAMTVTAAAGNVLRGLAGAPALERVQRVVAALTPEEQALASRGLQLGIAMDEYAEEHERGDFLVRGVLGAEPETSGVVVGDLVEVGTTVRLQVRDADAADEELTRLLGRHREGGESSGALLFSCNGRGAALFGPSYGGADHDVTVVRRELGTPGVAGFFAGGEIGPVGGRNHLHGFTAAVLAFPVTAEPALEPVGELGAPVLVPVPAPAREPAGAPVLAVDIGGTKLAAALVDPDGTVRRASRVPTGLQPWEALQVLLDDVRGDEDVLGVGVGCGGPMTWPEAYVTPPNTPAWRDGFPLGDALRARYPALPVRVHNDVVALAVGEHWQGAGRGVDDLLGMVVSTGVGGGVILGGRVVDGRSGNAGHVGHQVVEPDGPVCGCGGRGCLEAVARGPATVAWAQERGSRAQDGRELAALAQAGDEVALAALARSGRALGIGIASAAAVLDVALVLLGGGLSQAGEPLWGPLRAAVAEHARVPFLADLRVEPTALGQDSGLVGAAALVHCGDTYWSVG